MSAYDFLVLCQNIGTDYGSVFVLQIPGAGTGGDFSRCLVQDAGDFVASGYLVVLVFTSPGVGIGEGCGVRV